MVAATRRALVVGGGIAGPVAAMALQRAGLDVTVHEAGPQAPCDLGGWLGLQANGLDALRAVGADGPVLDAGFPTGSVRFASGTGRSLGVVSISSPRPGASVGRTLRRDVLYRLLQQQALDRGIAFHHGSRLVDARSDPDGVQAVFADGSTQRADLLVGADGVRSRVRSLLDPTCPPAAYVPFLSVGGYAEHTAPGAQVGQLVMVFGIRALFGHVAAPDGRTWWFASPPEPVEPTGTALAAVTDATWRSRLRELYRGDRSPALDLLEATTEPLRPWRSYDLASVRVWHDERTVLVGDAAHAVSPSTGQGASLAIEDAVELARFVRDLPLGQALAAYELARRPRVERVVALGRRTSTRRTPGPVGRFARDLVMPLALRRAARRGDAPVAWLHQHHVEWDDLVTRRG